ncbi:basic helix-loop-helix and HMG box domain-containing protein 1-like [Oncorhynchus mykiss]|uniref:basic helix-loop-helix and HMG box domain-containing protein 1-like n=1 Tax=Oncorhynchus mykiss TaxID=8022 RepID=UPI000B4F614B|nr:basic helix-loop-helix and HMG box domain-containing protein 1-like [Oncorhynchus mykiss]
MAAMSLNSTHPGTPSTVVTKELASLWHIMPKQERCVYCLKARRFSRQQNQTVRSELVEGEGDREEEDCVPTPSTCCWPRETLVLQPEEAHREATS